MDPGIFAWETLTINLVTSTVRDDERLTPGRANTEGFSHFSSGSANRTTSHRWP